MNLFASVGRRGVSLGLLIAACALMALPAHANAGSGATLLTAIDRGAPQSVSASAKPVADVSTTKESASAQLVKAQAKEAVAMPDDREFPFPRGWMLALLAVLVVVLVDRVRLSAKLSKLNEDALRSSGLSAPLVRN
jgi:hypothetical protein